MINAADVAKRLDLGTDDEWRSVEAAIDSEIASTSGPEVVVDFCDAGISGSALERAKAAYGGGGWRVAIEHADRRDLGPVLRLTARC